MGAGFDSWEFYLYPPPDDETLRDSGVPDSGVAAGPWSS